MDIKLLNGAVMAILGLLVIATPVLKEMSARDARLNWIAGGVLFVSGIFLLYLYVQGREHPSSKDNK